MKQQEKTKDQAVGDLLRAYVSRPTNPRKLCAEFDPDLANAYVERQLSGLSRSKYENHLSTCAECRGGVLTLARLAHAEKPTTLPAPRPQAGIFGSLQNAFRSLTVPQWAMATAAVLVLAISIPVILSRSNKSVVRPGDAIIAEQAPEKLAEDKNIPAGLPSATGDLAQNSTASAHKVAAVNEESQRRGETESPAGTAAPAREDQAIDALALAKAEPKQQPPAEQTQLKNEVQQQAPQPSAPQAQASGDLLQAKKEDTARQQEKDVAQAPGQKPVSQSVVVDEKAKTTENEKVASPPPPDNSRSNEPTRPLGRSRARLGLRDSSGETVPPRNADREIRGKKFYLKDGTWTDRDYNPDKDLPIITLIRDSNVYKEVLNRRASLKPFLDYFAESERAIIVYKGTVYKLIPQAAEK